MCMGAAVPWCVYWRGGGVHTQAEIKPALGTWKLEVAPALTSLTTDAYTWTPQNWCARPPPLFDSPLSPIRYSRGHF
jgi:hypothetical protein